MIEVICQFVVEFGQQADLKLWKKLACAKEWRRCEYLLKKEAMYPTELNSHLIDALTTYHLVAVNVVFL